MCEMFLSISKADFKDCDEIGKIHVSAYQKRYTDFLPPEYLKNLTFESAAVNARKVIADGIQETFIIKLMEQTVGFCRLGIDEDDRNQGQLYAIYLSPDFWRKRIGSIFVNWCISYMSMKQFNTLSVWSFQKNEGSNQFYKKMGFEESGRTTIYKNKNNEIGIEFLMKL